MQSLITFICKKSTKYNEFIKIENESKKLLTEDPKINEN